MDRDLGSGPKQQEASLSISEILSGLRESGFGISLGLRLLPGRKVMTNLDSILKSRDITLLTKVRLVKVMAFPVRVGL